MRFVCDSCRAQYMISDDKVGPKGVKVRCKKCGFVILVRRTDAPLPEEDAQDRTQIMQDPLGALAAAGLSGSEQTVTASSGGNSVLGGLEDDEIGAVFDQVLKSGTHPTASVGSEAPDDGNDEDHAQTRVLDANLMKKLTDEAAAKSGDEKNGGAASHDWYVAVNDSQVGPLSVDKVKDLWSGGELGPDSLCWRAGFSDWIPLSEVQELATVLAPRPAKPAIVVPAPVAAVVKVPVESVFSSGGVSKTVRSEVPVSMGGVATTDDGGGWKPSAASALASLVKEEIDVLSKPAKGGSVARGEVGSGSLADVPSVEVSVPGANGTHSTESSRPTPATNGYPGASYPSYRPPPAAVTGSSRKGVILGVVGGGVLVIGLLVAILWILANPKQPAITVNVPTAPLPAPTAPAPAAPAKAADPAPAPKPEAVAQVPAPTPPGPAALPPVRTLPSERRSPRPEKRGPRGSQVSEDDEVGSFSVGSKPAPPPPDPGGSDADFEREFGDKTQSTSATKGKRKTPSTYVPPAPGSADIPETLGQSDVIQVVVQNKPSILKCVDEQKKKDPGKSGRLVMRWNIQTSGKPNNVSVQSGEFKSTPMAGCLTKLISTWSFPRHKTQGPPIDFPFTF
ncbi:MAG TPA: AgmX/PglI C-terminal domain-containing protein [Myxococcaceae bacterium]|nr:AgmX/PglI C-terminal domain-containing protein [Myxococcaceae bacterium]